MPSTARGQAGSPSFQLEATPSLGIQRAKSQVRLYLPRITIEPEPLDSATFDVICPLYMHSCRVSKEVVLNRSEKSGKLLRHSVSLDIESYPSDGLDHPSSLLRDSGCQAQVNAS
jgi:hypothetical protein